MVADRERFDDYEETIRAALDGLQARLWTCLPGSVLSYDATGRGLGAPTVAVQPGLKATVTAPDGSTHEQDLPPLPDVPLCFPGGGGCSLTFPIHIGDEVLVVFASRCIDFWHQSGGQQSTVDRRKHDLSDGFAILRPRSGGAPLGGISTTATQLRSDDGTTYLELNPAGKTINMVAPGGIFMNGALVTAAGDVITPTGVTLDTHTHTYLPGPGGATQTSVGVG